MLSRLSQYFWGNPPAAEIPFQPHPSWLAANRARREREAVVEAARTLPVPPPLQRHPPALVVPMAPVIPLEQRDEWGNAPLHNAVGYRRFDELRYLLRHGANIETSGNNGFTPLCAAAYVNNLEAAQLLIESGANKEALASACNPSVTPLTTAIRQGHVEMVRLLIMAGANVDNRDGSTCTPLILASGYGQREMAGMLLQAGANPQLVAQNGCSAEAIAANQGYFEIVELLRADAVRLAPMDFSLPREHNRLLQSLPAVSVEAKQAAEQAHLEVEQDAERDQFFEDLLDPVSLQPIKNPISFSNGQTCDAETLKMLKEKATDGRVLCPLTRDQLTEQDLNAKPNVLIQKYILEKEKLWAELQEQRRINGQLQQNARPAPTDQPLSQSDLRARRLNFYESEASNKRSKTEPQAAGTEVRKNTARV